MKDSFSNASDEFLTIAEQYSNKLHVSKCRKILDEKGELVIETPHYNSDKNIIRMDENIDVEEYAIIFRHEYGHFIDAQLNRPSMSELFYQAIIADSDWYDIETDMGRKNLDKMLSELKNSDVFDNRYISDILSGVFHNEKVIVDTYWENGVGYYHHTNNYWDEITGPEKAMQREVFANLFALYVENDSQVVSFMERYFPNSTKRFKITIGGQNDGHKRI